MTPRQIALLKIVTGLNVTVLRAVVRESADLASERYPAKAYPDGVRRQTQEDEISDALLALEKHLDTLAPATRVTAPDRSLAEAVLLWARTPQNHGGNPYCHDHVKMARRILGDE